MLSIVTIGLKKFVILKIRAEEKTNHHFTDMMNRVCDILTINFFATLKCAC